MIGQYYIRLNEYRQNDFNYVSMLVVENKPFSYDIGNYTGTREEVLDFVTRKTINRTLTSKNSLLIRYQTLDDVKIMRKHLKEDRFYSKYKIEMTPSVFAADENHNEFLEEILKKHSLQRKIFDIHLYKGRK